jgi:hypothetical protein
MNRLTKEHTIMPWNGKGEITSRIASVDFEIQFPRYREKK